MLTLFFSLTLFKKRNKVIRLGWRLGSISTKVEIKESGFKFPSSRNPHYPHSQS